MAGWLHGVFVGECLFVFPLCGFSLSLFCNYTVMAGWLVAWVLYECMLVRFSAVWILPFTLL